VQPGNPGNLTITSAQLAADQDALDMIKNHGYTLAITNASVSDVLGLNLQPALSANAKVKAIAIVDTTDNIANNLDALQRVGLRIKSIAQTDAATPLEITGTQYKNDKAVIGKIITSDLLAVMDASASMSVSDTGSNILVHWAELRAIGANLNSVSQSDNTALRLSADNYQLGVNDGLVAKLGGSSTFTVAGASVEQAQAIGSDPAVTQIEVN